MAEEDETNVKASRKQAAAKRDAGEQGSAGAAGRFPQGSPSGVNVQLKSANAVVLHGDHSNGNAISNNY